MLYIDNLSVVYPDKTKAVDRLSLHVNDGENVGLVGANGAGKTTLLLTLVGVVPASEGTITVNDTKLRKETLADMRARVGLVFQNPDDQLFMPAIYDDVAFGPRNAGLTEEDVRSHVDDSLSRLGITHLRDRSALKLSGGEKRLAAIATVLSMNPSIMLLDEPTAFLDPKARRNLVNLLGSMSLTKIIASHDLSFVERTSSRVVLIKHGTIFADGTCDILHDRKLMEDCDLEAI